MSSKSKSKSTKSTKSTAIKTPIKNMTEQLPVSVLAKILSYLNIDDLFKTRRVNKNWNDATSKVKIQEIAFQDIQIYIQTNHLLDCMWVHTNAPFKNLVKLHDERNPKYNLLKSLSFDFTRLKRLKSDYAFDCEADISFINKFIELEQLEFGCKHTQSENKTLRLPNLKILAITRIDVGYLYLEVPNLEAFYSKNGFELIKFYEPARKPFDTVGAIDLTTINQSVWSGNFDVSCVRKYEILQHLPKLNFVRLFYMDCMPFYPHIDCIYETIKLLLRQKAEFKRTNLRIYLGQKLITSADQLDDKSLGNAGKEHVFTFSFEDMMRGLNMNRK